MTAARPTNIVIGHLMGPILLIKKLPSSDGLQFWSTGQFNGHDFKLQPGTTAEYPAGQSDTHNRLLLTGLISATNRTEIENCHSQKFLKRSARMMKNGSRCGAGIDCFTRFCTHSSGILHYVVVYIDVSRSISQSTIDWLPNVNPMQNS